MAEAPLGMISPGANDRYTLTFERDLPYSQTEVWRAVTSNEHLSCWLSDAEVELRPQGRIRLSGQCQVDGQILEVTPPSCIIWTWPHADHARSQVQIAIEAVGDAGSRLTLVQNDLPRRHVLDVAAGWHTHLDALPAAVLGEKTPFDPAGAAAHYRRYTERLTA